MKPNPIASTPYFAVDAPWLDAQWFATRPERQYRLLLPHHSEFASLGGSTHILVQKICTVERQRLPVSLLAVPANIKALLQSESPDAADTDAVLAEMFVALLMGRTFDLRRVVRVGLSKLRRASAAVKPSEKAVAA